MPAAVSLTRLCRPCPTVDRGHRRRPQPDGPLPVAGPAGPHDERAAQRVRDSFPSTCALGVYAFDVDRWADSDGRERQAESPSVDPPYSAGAAGGSANAAPGSQRRPARHRRTAPTAPIQPPRRRSSSSSGERTRGRRSSRSGGRARSPHR